MRTAQPDDLQDLIKTKKCNLDHILLLTEQ